MSNQVQLQVVPAVVPAVQTTAPAVATVVELTAPGPQGPPGAAGAAGPAGVGSAWVQGAGVPSAGTGSNGDFYLNTTNGDIYGPKTAGAWGGVIFNIAEGQQGPAGAAGAPGAQGPAGVDGRTLLSGTTAPGAGTGANGDFFIDTAASVIYGPKVGGAWPTGVSLVGPAGAAGAQGPAGPQGPQGIQGPQGDAGAAGAQGPAGATGATGPAGATGATGPQGPAGVVAATAPITYDAGTQTVGISAATTGAAGSMSATDKSKLDGLPSDFNAEARAQTEAALVAGSNITLTPSGSGANRQITIAATGGGGDSGPGGALFLASLFV